MNSRLVAVSLGLISGIAAFLLLRFQWDAMTTPLHLNQASFASAFAESPVRWAWSASAAAMTFSVVALLAALIGGLVEAAQARIQINKLRHDPALADRWNAADWRAAFTPTAVAEQAEAMITLLPIEKGETRRVVVDTAILLGLNRIWLDRLTLTRVIAPMPTMLLGLAATLGLFAYASGNRWDVVVAAGTIGWLVIHLASYLVRAALAPLVNSAVAGATAALRPLSSVQAIEAGKPVSAVAGPGGRIAQDEAEIIAAALSNVIWEPLGRLADAAEKLSVAGAPQSRDQAIEAALAEVRAGIERLLSNTGDG